MSKPFVVFATLLVVLLSEEKVEAKKVSFVHWNRDSPLFRIDNTDHIVDVEEYDQVNLICPTSGPGARYPEKHVIYSVSREEYESCRITNPKPRIVAICNKPHRLMYFTITFRSFTPTPGGLEFHPGHDYYFISTSSREDLHRRVGGGCSTHNMKMIFKVHQKPSEGFQDLNEPLMNLLPLSKTPTTTTTTTTTTTPTPIRRFSSYNDVFSNLAKIPGNRRRQSNDYIYYYHPRDVVAMEDAFDIVSDELMEEEDRYGDMENALRLTSSSPRAAASSAASASLRLPASSGLTALTVSLIVTLLCSSHSRWW